MKLLGRLLLSAALAASSVTSEEVSRVFITSTSQDGALGGLDGADAICQALARSKGLPGLYLAWLSNSTHSPNSRFVKSTVPYTLIDGISRVADDWNDLTDGTLNVPINVDEFGNTIAAPPQVWTNTKTDGTRNSAIFHCNDWTSSDSSVNGFNSLSSSTNFAWTSYDLRDCSNSYRLYCFQQFGLEPPPSQGISPAPTYDIDLSECDFIADITNVDIGTVTCTFDADGDSNHVVESVIKGPDCSADNTNNGLALSTDSTPNGKSSTYAASVSIDNSALQEGEDFVAFCIQASVKAGGSDDVYAQLGQKVRLDLAFDGSFSFNTTAAVADTISAEADELDTELTVEAYQCDDSGTETSDDLSLDDTLYICIDGVQDTVIVVDIDNLQAEKSGVSESPLSIIEDGPTITNPAITAINNRNSNKVIVTTKLPIGFFKSTEAVTVSGC